MNIWETGNHEQNLQQEPETIKDMEEYSSPSKLSVNTQRLSAMIDSLGSPNAEEPLPAEYNTTSSHLSHHTTSSPAPQSEDTFTSPLKKSTFQMPRSPATDNLNNRASVLSNYSGVVDHAIEVSYVVRNSPSKSIKNRDETGKEDTEENGNNSELQTKVPESTTDGEVVIQSVQNAKPVGRFGSFNRSVSSKVIPSDKDSNSKKAESIHLATTSKKPLHSSIGSGNLASESGTSSYSYDQTLKNLDQQLQIPDVDDESSITSSANMPSLATNKYTKSQEDIEVPHLRTETTAFNPTIPPRSKDRPRSRIFGTEENQSEAISPPQRPINHNYSRSDAAKSESYYSAISYNSQEDLHEKSQNAGNDELPMDDSYLSRPLPITPHNNREIYRDDTIKAFSGRPELPSKNSFVDNNNEYEDILDEDEAEEFQYAPVHQENSQKNTPIQKVNQPNKLKSKKKNKKKNTREDIQSFDIETLNQLVNVTKGTLIGSEFSNLGMRTEEKKALERLVDSLSRLTADMVLDPERYEEGLKRLDKATRALEGFY
ncbi:hypothetical protein B1J92_I08107g [Nakaseomyces glabratus]|nr:hypothetical protein B1J91_I08107g [Nakaseomyces glabratus]OXB47844.1 hypothetical protein B1J92_I08107g [Nakaseomyces glabratus]